MTNAEPSTPLVRLVRDLDVLTDRYRGGVGLPPGANWYADLGLSPVCPWALEFIGTVAWQPFVRRLHEIAQLGTTGRGTYASAMHTRWAHSVGVANTMGACIDTLEKQDGVDIPPEWRHAALLGSLLHDSLQGPWGHSLEFASELFGVETNEIGGRLDKFLLRRALQDPEHDLRKAITTSLRLDARELEDLLAKVVAIVDPDVCMETAPEYFFLAQLLDCDMDADRLEYIVSDHRFTTSDHSAQQSLSERRARIIAGLSVCEVEHSDKPYRVLAFSEATRSDVRALLDRRSTSYEEIYESPAKVSLDEMLAHSLVYMFLSCGYFEVDLSSNDPLRPLPPKETRGQITSLLGALTDGGFVSLIDLLAPAIGTSQAKWAKRLCTDATLNFETAGFIPVGDVPRVGFAERNALVTEVDALLKRVNANPASRAIEELTKELQDPRRGATVDLVAFARLAATYGAKFQAERALWSRLWGLDDFRDLACAYLNMIGFENPAEDFREIPLIHIARPWHPVLSSGISMFATDLPSAGRPGYRFLNTDGKCRDEPELVTSGQLWMPFVSCPRWLAEKAHDTILKEWRQFVRDGYPEWLPAVPRGTRVGG